MILNSRSANYIFAFPRGFFYSEIEEKYIPYVKRNPLPYDTIATFMASTIQSVNFPNIAMAEVQQTRNLGKKQEFKNSVPLPDLVNREFTVSFKHTDGYINYWIMLENTLQYLNFSNKQLYFDDCYLRFLDVEGFVITSARFHGVWFKSLSEISLSYSDNNPDFKAFDVTFGFLKMELKVEND